MTWLLSCLFRLLLWCLLTGDRSGLNLLIGAIVAVLLPQRRGRSDLLSLLRALVQAIAAIPHAYAEAFRLMLAPAETEQWLERPSSGTRTAAAIFLEVFAITLTPFTLVLGVSAGPDGPTYRIHQLQPSSGLEEREP
ncbi:sodium:proton antiporter [Synechococcus sp. WH 8101]|jgi:multicomponent Na+:H+ antiporter subunit E|uniref:Na+/H+ antiporter subunit E n=1 Tax=Synechococcus sp. WH 8101 TaxID=59932 RepID=UPI0010231C88|nr:Na+/H+ antiporter subunit E [Synechococcus sp. WH 8101]QBE69346.1 sodium:proton antiporter [Synechococcus sp. WH 8101]